MKTVSTLHDDSFCGGISKGPGLAFSGLVAAIAAGQYEPEPP
jgi:hypothetical protein